MVVATLVLVKHEGWRYAVRRYEKRKPLAENGRTKRPPSLSPCGDIEKLTHKNVDRHDFEHRRRAGQGPDKSRFTQNVCPSWAAYM